MLDKLIRIWKIRDLRNSILFILAMIVVFRFAAHIPIPGINIDELAKFLDSNQVFGILNLFSGGGMKNFSIVMLGVAPYITASIIMQLLTMIVPSLEELSKEGEYGRRKITMYTRWLTIPLAIIQTLGMISLLRRSSYHIFESNLGLWSMILAITTITAGTIFLMWIGELISEKRIGNGISILIFVGIVSYLPNSLKTLIVNFDQSQVINLIVFAILAIITIVAVVFITEGQRNIPITYTRHMEGSQVYGGINSHLPIRVNMAGVIPIIFAISLMLFPPMIAQLFVGAKTAWVASFATKVVALWQNQVFYTITYFAMVVIFTYFYTAVIFQPEKIAENLQKQGAFIHGYRPGKETAEYLQYVINRLLVVGSVFLGIIAILPYLIQFVMPSAMFRIGGTSLLIVVSVVIEIIKQINAQLIMRDYDTL